jgi:hypothetical protein
MKAKQFIDKMEKNGIIGPYPEREILVDPMKELYKRGWPQSQLFEFQIEESENFRKE